MFRLAGRARYVAAIVAGLLLLLFIFPQPARLLFPQDPVTVDADVLLSPIPPSDPHTPPPRILLVSAFFPLAKSKHTMDDYASWMEHFLSRITTDVYMFCSPDVAPLITRLRGDFPITLNTTYATPFDIPPLAGREARYEQMHTWDREAFRHSPALYAVWNAKPFFLAEGVRNARAAYDFAFWSDAGSLRGDHPYRAWPDPRRVQAVFEEAEQESAAPDNLIFIPIANVPSTKYMYWTENMGPADASVDVSEGSFFGGKPAAVENYRHLYYAYHDVYLSRSVFVGKDQTLINQLLLLFPAHFFTVWLRDPAAPAARTVPWGTSSPLGACGDHWWFYQWWLAAEADRERMADVWFEREHPPWWKGTARCRDTRLLTMEQLWRTVFGRSWAPHPAYIATWGTH
ncbi:hypothetical protein OF83DRAFT_1177296 [Amylostereum chailletii]|nr:hypothetical protein OF83DRAFT_1177296 [Amylostereum chailletii]